MSKIGEEYPRYCDICVYADPVIIVHDDDAASLLKKDLLLKWYECDGLEVYIDRYDVRNYFEYEKFPQKLNNTQGIECDDVSMDEEELLCQALRYKDLENPPLPSENSESEDSTSEGNRRYSETIENCGNPPSKSNRNLSKSFSSSNSSSGTDQDIPLKTRTYQSSHKNDQLGSHLSQRREDSSESIIINGMQAPKGDRLRTILHKTALFVRNSTNPQVEVLIRVNQQDNTNLSFIHHSDKFYKYYTAVKNGEVTLRTEDANLLEQETSGASRNQNPKSQSNQDTKELSSYTNYYSGSTQFMYGDYNKYYAWNPYTHNNTVLNTQEPLLERVESIIKKVANFVAKNGSQFEDIVRKRQISNPDFKFLNPQSELYNYYRTILDKIKNTKDTIESSEHSKRRSISLPSPNTSTTPQRNNSISPPPPET